MRGRWCRGRAACGSRRRAAAPAGPPRCAASRARRRWRGRGSAASRPSRPSAGARWSARRRRRLGPRAVAPRRRAVRRARSRRGPGRRRARGRRRETAAAGRATPVSTRPAHGARARVQARDDAVSRSRTAARRRRRSAGPGRTRPATAPRRSGVERPHRAVAGRHEDVAAVRGERRRHAARRRASSRPRRAGRSAGAARDGSRAAGEGRRRARSSRAEARDKTAAIYNDAHGGPGRARARAGGIIAAPARFHAERHHPDSRFRLAVHPADRAPPARAVRSTPRSCRRRRAPRRSQARHPSGHRALGRARQRPPAQGAALRPEALRAGRARPRASATACSS